MPQGSQEVCCLSPQKVCRLKNDCCLTWLSVLTQSLVVMLLLLNGMMGKVKYLGIIHQTIVVLHQRHMTRSRYP